MKKRLKLVLLTIDRAGEILINRLAGSICNEVEISLVVTRETRNYDFGGNPVVNACSRLGIECIQPDFSKNLYLKKIQKLAPDLIVISNFHKIIKSDLINIPKLGTFNLHSSLLPELRGGTSVIWALKKGLDETGVTLHVVTEGVDDGEIISQRKVPISFWDSQGSLYEKVTLTKFDLLVEFLRAIKQGKKIEKKEQDHKLATYLPKRKDEDGLLNIDDEMVTLYNHIRSFDPWTGAYFPLGSEKIRLRSVIPVTKFLESKVADGSLIISRNNRGKIKSLIISSVTDVVEQPNLFDREMAIKVLKYWKENDKE